MADLNLSFTILDADVQTAKDGFLRVNPKPASGPDAALTDIQWIKKVIIGYIRGQIQDGQKAIARDAVAVDPSIVS